MKLVLAEKPSVAQSIAKVLGAAKREDGYLEGNGYVVSWCVGHLVELCEALTLMKEQLSEDESELFALADSVLRKVSAMDDAAFEKLNLYPD